MLILISPSKDLNFKTPASFDFPIVVPQAIQYSLQLVDILKTKSARQLKSLMDISVKLANENVDRYQQFSQTWTSENSKPAIYAFAGDVYRGLDAYSLSQKDINYAQTHLRILSGLYGLLKPLDWIQPYRLEMGVSLKVNKSKNLYQFWGTKITDWVNQLCKENKFDTIIHLASDEYYNVVQEANLQAKVLRIHFKDRKNEKLIFVSFTAKKARGAFARSIIENQFQSVEDLKRIVVDNYVFEPQLSDTSNFYFIK